MDFSFLFWLLLAGTLVMAVVFLGKKLWMYWGTQKKMRQRQQVEDTLKLIFDLHQDNQMIDQYRLAVELKISLPVVQALISKLQSSQLIQFDQTHYLKLTPEGQRWALQVIRAHRLWELYLADEARMPLEHIHSAANRREHQMSLEEINALDAAMGHPIHDPHGDPIPNEAGALRDKRIGTPLVSMHPGQYGQITHLEDEPPLAYAQLLAEGLYVGQSVLIQENIPSRIVLTSAENEYTLAPSIAKNVYIITDTVKKEPDRKVILLGNLPPKAQAEIVSIDERCQGFTRRRLLDLGITPGTMIFPELENVFHDPRAYRVRGTLIALRSDQSNMILVRPV